MTQFIWRDRLSFHYYVKTLLDYCPLLQANKIKKAFSNEVFPRISCSLKGNIVYKNKMTLGVQHVQGIMHIFCYQAVDCGVL